jgi:glycosyltransferase involved in cell wall biosynthesis
MDVLFIHNHYKSALPSGENEVLKMEIDLLEKNNNKVSFYYRYSDDLINLGKLGVIKGAILTPYNFKSKSVALEVFDKHKPDIVHVHNTFPLISPSIFHAVGNKAARVLTLHNYRIFCPAAIPMRNGKVCTECLDKKSAIPSLIHGCYRNSRVATLPLAIKVWLHRALGTWTNEVDAFICLSEFQRDLMIDAGLPAEKVHVKPNFYPGNPAVIPWQQRKPYVVFAGRLTAEKGVINLLKAWQLWGADAPELHIVGDGELRQELESLAKDLPVRFLGQVSAEEAQQQIAQACLQILPSEWFEGFPMVVREAFAFGTPAAVSDLGPLPTIVEHGKSGIVFQPANPQSLLAKVREAWETPGLLEVLGAGARHEFESKYTEEANYRILMDIYQKAIEVSKRDR